MKMYKIKMIIFTVTLLLLFGEVWAEKCPAKCRCYKNKKYMIADCSHKKLVNIPNGFPPTINKLVLDSNLITRLPEGSFQSMPDLHEISIKSNKIFKVDPKAFTGLQNLIKIQLTKNQLDMLPVNVFTDNKKLKQLYLTSNNFHNIPNFYPMPQNFDTLGLDSNNIQNASIPNGYLNVAKLKLILSNNHKLGKIRKDDFANLSGKLTVLRLSHCGLKSIENGTLIDQTQLSSLTLSYNNNLQISNLMNIFDDLRSSIHLNYLDLAGIIQEKGLIGQLNFTALKGKKNLRTVSLSKNYISVLRDKFFSAFQNLQTLFLKDCKISYAVPLAFEGLNKLERLDLSINRLSLLPGLQTLTNLEKLDLSNNHELIGIQDNAFIELKKLKRLNMNYCGITNIHENSFLGLSNLDTLEIAHNRLPHVPSKTFVPMISLITLNLGNNLLTTIPQGYENIFKGLGKLKQLDISSNGMKILPTSVFRSLLNLTSLELDGNKLGRIIDKDTGSLFSSQRNLISLNLERNSITTIPNDIFKNLASLEILKLSHNDLSHWGAQSFNRTIRLKQLSMDYNQISIVNQTSVSSFQDSMKLNLSGNPFNCGCDLRWFRKWLNTTNVKLVDLTHYTCDSPQSMFGKSLLDFNPDSIVCWHFPWYYALAGGIFIAALLIITVGSLLYKFRWPIRYRLFMFRRRKTNKDDKDALLAEYEYDAIIIFSRQQPDRSWIDNYLLPAMDADVNDENNVCEPGAKFKLWHDERDLDTGKGKAEIFEVIIQSKMMILVISSKFHKEDLCSYILKTLAPMKASNSHYGNNALIFIILDEGSDLQIPQWYHEALHGGQQVIWTPDDVDGQRLFWQRLRDRLGQEISL